MKRLAIALLPLTLAACASNPPAPPKPILSCQDCTGLVYFGEQAPQQSETVTIAGILAGAATSIAGYGFAADTVKGLTSTAASAGRIQVVEQPEPTIVRPEVILAPGATVAE